MHQLKTFMPIDISGKDYQLGHHEELIVGNRRYIVTLDQEVFNEIT